MTERTTLQMVDRELAELEAKRKAGDKLTREEKMRYADLVNLRPELDVTTPRRLQDFVSLAAKRIERRFNGDETPIELPWPDINTKIGGGLWPGLYTLVGTTGTGKTQWALQAALAAARAKVPVLYIGLELGELEITTRLLSLADDKAPRWSDLYLGDRSEIEGWFTSQGEGLTQALGAIEGLPLHLETGPPHGWGYDRLYNVAKATKRAHPGADQLLVVLDFLQLVGGPERDLRERIARASYAARAVARDLDATVLVISSTSRGNYETLSGGGSTFKLGEDPPARLVGMAKESGDIEYSSDGVLVLARDPGRRELIHVALAKLRARRDDWAKLYFNGDRFTPWQSGSMKI